MRVVTSVLGGAFTSRLMQELRERHGYTYGSYARHVPLAGVGYIDIDAAVETGVTGAALARLFEIVEGLAEGDIEAREAAKAVATLQADRITALQRLGGVLDTYEIYAAEGEGPDAFARDLAALASPANADPGHLNEVARRWVRPGSGVLVLVGDRARIEEQLGGLGLPEPEILTPEEALAR